VNPGELQLPKDLPDPSPGTWKQSAQGLALSVPLDDGSEHLLQAHFLTGAMGYRLKHGGGRGQAVARAMGMKKGRTPPTVVDATAGLGRDSFLLAWLGCKVVALERDARIFALLQDGLRRALLDPECHEGLGDQLTFIHADAISWLRHADAFLPDVVYLDPMHPERRKSAQVRKEMRMFRALVGSDTDSKELLQEALRIAQDRVVVKRPRIGEELLAKPSHVQQGKSTRFDIYLQTIKD
jgi:16S rRNA (guanine1516-N2)-methyltransferase